MSAAGAAGAGGARHGRAIHQFLPTYEPGAIGTHAARLQRALRTSGFESEIFCEFRHPGMAPSHLHTRYGNSYAANAGDVLLYHVALGSNVADFLLERPETLAVDYHNITPAFYFETWAPEAVGGIDWGREQLAALAPRTALGIGDSEYNAAELRGIGYGRAVALPILFDASDFAAAVAPDVRSVLDAARRRDGGANWLFVGRVSPHKAQHGVIEAFALYRRLYDPAARLYLIGGSASAGYTNALHRLANRLGVGDALFLPGSVSQGALVAYYDMADVLVCLSEHEGFCVPLLEAMYHDVPIVAYNAGAVAETLAGAGVLLPSKQAAVVAAAVHLVRSGTRLRNTMISAGRKRLADFDVERNAGEFVEALDALP